MKHKKIVILFFSLLMLSVVTYALNKAIGFTGAAANSNSMEEKADAEVPTDDDPWKEMENLVNVYYNKNGIHYKGKTKLIDDNGPQEKVIEELSFEYTLIGEAYYYHMGSIEMVSKKGLLLAVDNSARTVIVNIQESNLFSDKQFLDFKKFKELLQNKEAQLNVSKLGEEKVLTVDNVQDPIIQGYRIFYHPDTYRVSKIEIGMVRTQALPEETEPGKAEDTSESIIEPKEDDTPSLFTYFLEIEFAEIRELAISIDNFFPERKFIEQTGNEVQLTPAYAGYTLVGTGE